MDTSNLQLNTEQFPIKDIKKLAEQFLHIGWMRKTNTETVGEAERQSRHNPTPSMAAHNNREWTHNSKILPEEQRVWTSQWAPHNLRPTPDRWKHKVSTFESHQDSCQKTQRATELRNRLHLLAPQGTVQKQTIWKAPSLPVKEPYFVYFEASSWGAGI